MIAEATFGQIVRERRLGLGLTQAELARRVNCATVTIRKIEYDNLRPSVQVAERLALSLNIPEAEQLAFVRLARTDLPQMPIPTPAPMPEEIGQEDLSGRSVHGYELGERIGTGGFGVVYRAVQPSVDRDVAIKIILPEYANHPNFIRRFEVEAQTIAQLEHPHIVPLYDYWREPNAAYLIMRLLRGGSLESKIKRGSLPLAVINRYLQQIGQGLYLAHRNGVIHRDLKPANILLDEDDNAYLADFGIAKHLDEWTAVDKTEMGALVGSPAYASPEQLRAERIKPQTDIYCLGIMLYELLAGERPFPGPTPVLYIQQHLFELLPPISQQNAALPPALDEILLRATAKDPAERYPDVLSLLEALQPVLLGRNGRSTPITLTESAFPQLSTQELADLENPFKGLRAFSEADSDSFFGRDSLVHDLLGRISDSVNGGQDLTRFLAVVGPSGSGKSSVVKAGLLPALRQGGVPGSEGWFMVDMMPSAKPMAELAAALLRVAIHPPGNLLEQLQFDERGLLRVLEQILPSDGTTELLLVIDQFEETFTLVADEATRVHFLDSLVTAVLDERSRLRVVVTLRADFTDRPLQYVDFGELVRKRTEFVLPLSPDELEEAITRPVTQLGLTLEPGLVAQIMRDVGDEPGTLPLLQYALTELFERREGAVLTRAAYEASGGVLGALARRAEEIYSGLDDVEQEAARQLFFRLVTLGEGVEDTRRRVLLSELEGLSVNRNLLSVNGDRNADYGLPITEYGKYRLLTFDHDPSTREPTVEVAHEALLRKWRRLREWLAESRDDVRMQRLLANEAREWEQAQQDPSYLLRGARLVQFEGWAATTTIALTRHERIYLQASLNAREQRQAEEEARRQRELATAQKLAAEQSQAARRLRQFVVGLTIFLVIALGATWFALVERNTAQENFVASERIRLASQAQNALDRGEGGDLPALLALRSLQLGYSPEADAALQTALRRGFSRQQYLGHLGSVFNGNFSPDGRLIVTSSEDGIVRLWQAQTGELMRQFVGHTGLVNSALFSPDGQMIISAGIDGTARLWDVTSGEEVGRFTSPSNIFWSAKFSPDGQLVAASEGTDLSLWDVTTDQTIWRVGHTGIVFWSDFSPDGRFIATASSDGTAHLWDRATGEEVRQFLGHTDIVNSVDISPDGRFLVTASNDQTIRIWDITAGFEVRRFVGHTDSVIGAFFSPDGRNILSGGQDRTARLWDVQTGQELRQILGHTAAVRTAFAPDGQHILTVGEDGAVRLWETAVVSEPQTALNYGPGHAAFLNDVAIAPDGKTVLTGQTDGSVYLWQTATGEAGLQFSREGVSATSLAFAPTQQLVIIGDESGLLSIGDLDTGQMIQQFQAANSEIQQALFAPDGVSILTAGEDQIGYLWDADTGNAQQQFVGHNGTIQAIAFANDGQTVVTGSDDQTAILWDVASGQQRHQFKGHHGAVLAVAIAPNNQTILTGSADHTAVLWNADSGEMLFELSGHTDQVTHVSFSPDGRYALTGSDDQTARLWDTSNGQLLRQYTGHISPLQQAIFSEDGQQIFTADNRSIYIWRVTLADTIAFACEQLSRELTAEERTFYTIETDTLTCPTLGQQIAQAEPTWTPTAPDIGQPVPLSFVIDIEFVNAEPAMVSMAMPMQWVFVSAGEDEIVRLETLDEEILNMPLYSSRDTTPTDLVAPFETGPFPKGEALNITLREYAAAGGGGTYTLQGSRALVELTFNSLVPNGVYTLWCVEYTVVPEPITLQEVPCGAADGSENAFVADGEGNGSLSLEMDAFPPSTSEVIYEFAVAYHSDGLTHGEVVGESGKNVHIQLLYDFAPPGQ